MVCAAFDFNGVSTVWLDCDNMSCFPVAALLLRVCLHADRLSDYKFWQIFCTFIVVLFAHLSAFDDIE